MCCFDWRDELNLVYTKINFIEYLINYLSWIGTTWKNKMRKLLCAVSTTGSWTDVFIEFFQSLRSTKGPSRTADIDNAAVRNASAPSPTSREFFRICRRMVELNDTGFSKFARTNKTKWNFFSGFSTQLSRTPTPDAGSVWPRWTLHIRESSTCTADKQMWE